MLAAAVLNSAGLGLYPGRAGRGPGPATGQPDHQARQPGRSGNASRPGNAEPGLSRRSGGGCPLPVPAAAGSLRCHMARSPQPLRGCHWATAGPAGPRPLTGSARGSGHLRQPVGSHASVSAAQPGKRALNTAQAASLRQPPWPCAAARTVASDSNRHARFESHGPGLLVVKRVRREVPHGGIVAMRSLSSE